MFKKDEANMFLSSFGRYNGGNAQYDRACYNELATGPNRFQRDLKTGEQRINIKDPRLNICLLGMNYYLLIFI